MFMYQQSNWKKKHMKKKKKKKKGCGYYENVYSATDF